MARTYIDVKKPVMPSSIFHWEHRKAKHKTTVVLFLRKSATTAAVETGKTLSPKKLSRQYLLGLVSLSSQPS